MPLAPDGRFLIGFDRDAATSARLAARLGDGREMAETLRSRRAAGESSASAWRAHLAARRPHISACAIKIGQQRNASHGTNREHEKNAFQLAPTETYCCSPETNGEEQDGVMIQALHAQERRQRGQGNAPRGRRLHDFPDPGQSEKNKQSPQPVGSNRIAVSDHHRVETHERDRNQWDANPKHPRVVPERAENQQADQDAEDTQLSITNRCRTPAKGRSTRKKSAGNES